MKVDIGTLYVLDGLEFYDGPSEELTRLAVEQFLDWRKPPSKLVMHPLGDGRWGVEAHGGRP